MLLLQVLIDGRFSAPANVPGFGKRRRTTGRPRSGRLRCWQLTSHETTGRAIDTVDPAGDDQLLNGTTHRFSTNQVRGASFLRVLFLDVSVLAGPHHTFAHTDIYVPFAETLLFHFVRAFSLHQVVSGLACFDACLCIYVWLGATGLVGLG